MEAKNICIQQKIILLSGQKLKSKKTSILLTLQKGKEQFQIRIRYGMQKLSGYAKVVIVLTELDEVGPQDFNLLAELKWKKNLIINPYTKNKKLLTFAALTQDEVLLLLPMEPYNYPYKKPGEGALFIHLSLDEIDKLLSEKLTILPEAKGFATYMGDRAIENANLLTHIFKFTGPKSLSFLDLTNSQRSLSRQTARKENVLCRRSRQINSQEQILLRFNKSTIKAQKSGEAILVFKYSSQALKIINKQVEKLQKSNSGLLFTTFSELDVF
ncbi:MAG: divergent polysaccharide deacetylase family protein [Fibrobacteria bacterium]|nr:divergent polysaccharide deacetylase family protein [Fibrobacteria bacterium]